MVEIRKYYGLLGYISKQKQKSLYIFCICCVYMTTEMINIKLEDKFLKDIDKVVKEERYHTRTEFIRNALREKLEESRIKQAMMEMVHIKGISKKKTTIDEYENIRKKAFEELSKKFKI